MHNASMDYGEASVSSLEPRDYPLHRAAFEDDVEGLKKLLASGLHDVAKRNANGDTALHVATMMGHADIIHLLLSAGAPVKLKNNSGWNPLVEAISYGNRAIIVEMTQALRLQAHQHLADRKPHLVRMLSELNDFILEFKWDFHSWVPLLSRMLPSDVCRIYKKGVALRMDTSLVDMNDKSWERGDLSFIFNPNNTENEFVVVDRKSKTFQKVKSAPNQKEVDEEVDVIMSSDVVDAHMSTKPIKFHRARSGWIFRYDKSEDICGFASDFFEVRHLNLITQKRREHLSPEDIKKNKSMMQKFTSGHELKEEELKWTGRRRDLPPPPRPMVSFEEYIGSIEPIPLGRTPVVKTNTKSFSAMVAMSEEFPLSVEILVDLLEVMAPVKHIDKLREFCRCRMPRGFPVKLEIPIFATITAKVTFQQFEWRNDLPDSMFQIPSDFRLEKSRFPDFS